MRHIITARLGVPAAAVAAGLLAAGPALADVRVSPASAVQGSGENLTFHVTNPGRAPISTVTLLLPADAPIAEAYPLSVDGWAPRIAMRALGTPLPTVHGGAATSATASITWLAVAGHALAPGGSADLPVALGPLPRLGAMRFTVVTTYADGRPGPGQPPATLTLTPDPDGQAAAAHAGHGGTATGTDQDAENARFAAPAAAEDRGPGAWPSAGWVAAGFALLATVLLVLRSRHRAEPPGDDEPEPEPDGGAGEPLTAGRWSLRG